MTAADSRFVHFSCPACRKTVRLPAGAAGKRVVCPGCGLHGSVPGRAMTPTPSSARIAGPAVWSPVAPAQPAARTPSSGENVSRRLTPSRPLQQVALAAVLSSVTLVAAMMVVVILAPGNKHNVDRPMPRSADEVSPPPVERGIGPATAVVVAPAPAVPPAVLDIELAGPSAADLNASLRPLIDEITALDGRKDGISERQAAVVRLRMYRRLCRVSDDVTLDDRLDEEALAAADICRRLGTLSHEPSNPGMPAAEFDKALRGARSGNLASGIEDLVRAVDGWIDDSDATNIAALGHRRWCLNPPLRRVGFGRIETWCAMWAHDRSGCVCVGGPAICFPPAGAVPIDMFRPHYAWSVTLDPNTFRKPRPDKVTVTVRDERAEAGSRPRLELDPLVIETHGYGIDNCIIFRPRGVSTAVGQRYLVVIEGIQDRTGAPARLRYAVEFVSQLVK